MTVTTAPTAHSGGRAEDEAALSGLLDGVMRTWAAGDADGFADLFLPEATLVADALMLGQDVIRNFMGHGFAGPYVGTRLEIVPVTTRFATPDAAWVVTSGGVLVGEETEAPLDRRFLATWLAVRRDGRWWIAAYQNTKGQSA